MTKIAYNACYGGFNLSDKAVERYAEIKGIVLYKEENTHFGYSSYYFCPVEEYHELISKAEAGDAEARARADEMFFAQFELYDDRTNPILIQVIEELGEEVNTDVSDIRIRELEAGTKYIIDEYDGAETVKTIDDINWLEA
jgi:dihydrodipicolinate synthase/N-acetylneuraminate lyase